MFKNHVNQKLKLMIKGPKIDFILIKQTFYLFLGPFGGRGFENAHETFKTSYYGTETSNGNLHLFPLETVRHEIQY